MKNRNRVNRGRAVSTIRGLLPPFLPKFFPILIAFQLNSWQFMLLPLFHSSRCSLLIRSCDIAGSIRKWWSQSKKVLEMDVDIQHSISIDLGMFDLRFRFGFSALIPKWIWSSKFENFSPFYSEPRQLFKAFWKNSKLQLFGRKRFDSFTKVSPKILNFIWIFSNNLYCIL